MTPQFINNKHALDKFFATQFKYKVVSTHQTTTIIGALNRLRIDSFGFNFIDVIQTYIELLRRNVHIDENLLDELKNLIAEFKDLLEPWVQAQSIIGDEKERKYKLPSRLAIVLKEKCENKLRIITESENPSQNFMHEMTKKLCEFFSYRMQQLHPNNINNEVKLGSTLYFMLLHYDQLLLPILKQLRVENETDEGKKMIIKVFDPRILFGTYAYNAYKGGKRTKRHKKRSGHKRSGHKRSGHKRSVHKSRRR